MNPEGGSSYDMEINGNTKKTRPLYNVCWYNRNWYSDKSIQKTVRHCHQLSRKQITNQLIAGKCYIPNHLLSLWSVYMQINFPELLGACIRYIYDFLTGDKTTVIERSNCDHNLHKTIRFHPCITYLKRFASFQRDSPRPLLSSTLNSFISEKVCVTTELYL